ncbi:MAG: efflux transporter outer membrane subunit [Deltaproteobacteria bacterium]|nr:MAG: efflux transporter outer membrane subunit [Deltaproteobacteria bacterium]
MDKRLLIIDDDLKLVELLKEYLGGYAFQVHSLPDGSGVLEALRTELPDIVILDIMLPREDGLEILRKIRTQSAIPVIMLTAKGEDSDRIVGLELGADDYLPKPFNPRELLARIKAVLRRVKAEGSGLAAGVEPEATVPVIQQQRRQTLNTMAILLAQNPGEFTLAHGSLTGKVIPPEIPVGLPSALLDRRPDVRRTEADLVAANADIGRAKAAMFPTIALTANGGYTSQHLSTLITPASSFYNLSATVLTPIFRGGALWGDYQRTKARHEELLNSYHQVIITTFREVEDNLEAIRRQGQRERIKTLEVAQAEKAYRISDLRYRQGLTDYIRVLDADRTLHTSRNDLVQARLDRLNALVALYRALGGGFGNSQEARQSPGGEAKPEKTAPLPLSANDERQPLVKEKYPDAF